MSIFFISRTFFYSGRFLRGRLYEKAFYSNNSFFCFIFAGLHSHIHSHQ